MSGLPVGRARPLELENEGQLSIFPLGTGGAFGKKLFQNNYVLVKGKTHLLIDAGTRATQAIVELGKSVLDFRNILVTHSHADHVGGLEEFILMGRYVAKKRPVLVIPEPYKTMLWEHSVKGGAAFNERHEGKALGFEDMFEPVYPKEFPSYPRQAWELDFGGIHLTLMRTMHFPDSAESWQDSAFSTGLVIDRRFLFTGDTRFDRALVEEALERFPIEAIFHDVQFFPGGVHASFQELCTLDEDVRSKTYLMHYPDAFETKLDEVLQAGFAGFVQQHRWYDFEGPAPAG